MTMCTYKREFEIICYVKTFHLKTVTTYRNTPPGNLLPPHMKLINLTEKGGRLLAKITDKHIYKDLIPKMKVKYAMQILNYTIASVIEMYGLLRQGKQ